MQKILSDLRLKASWKAELKAVSQRNVDIRAALELELTKIGAPGDWSFITKQKGMFSYTGFTPTQCDVMTNKWHCYIPRNGRISMSGVNSHNVNYWLAPSWTQLLASSKGLKGNHSAFQASSCCGRYIEEAAIQKYLIRQYAKSSPLMLEALQIFEEAEHFARYWKSRPCGVKTGSLTDAVKADDV